MIKKLMLAFATLVASMSFAFAQVDVNKADASALETTAHVESVVLPAHPDPVVAVPVPVPEDLLGSLVASPRTAVVSTDPARRLSPKLP